jgi:hypothetical protein
MSSLKAKTARCLILAGVCAFLFGNMYRVMGRPQEGDEVRDLTRTGWKNKRVGPTESASAADSKAASARDSVRQGAANPLYKVTRKMPRSANIPLPAEDSEIGITVWRLRPARNDDALEIRDLIQRSDRAVAEEWTPERVSSDAAVAEGEMVKFSIESLRSGFLYVITRPQYNDGAYGDPYLIFPTRQMYDGDNRVEAGRAVQIPGPGQQPFALARSQSRPNELQRGEELIIIVKPERFEVFANAPADRQKLTQQSVDDLIKKYAASYEVSESIGGAKRAITLAEKRAAQTSNARLSSANPYPQTIYRLAAKAGTPMLIRFNLKVRSE